MSLRHRLLLVLSAAGLTGAALVALGALGIVRSAALERSLERVRAETALVATWAERLDPSADRQAFVDGAATSLGLRVTLIDGAGSVLADSSVEGRRIAALENHLGRPEIQQARLGGAGEAQRDSVSTGETYHYSARLVPGGGAVRYVRLALPWSEIERLESGFALPLVAVVVVAMVLLVGLGYGAVRRLSRPIERLADGIEAANAGGLDAVLPVPHSAGREIERLARTIVGMRAALVETIAEVDRERALLASVVAGTREGLLLVGADRRVGLVNAALRRVLDLPRDPRGELLEAVVRHPAVLRDVDAALAGRAVEESVVRLPGSDRSFELRVAPLPGGAALVLFFDVTRLESLERVRRDFVADVSHELRTPLTSIKGFVENLLGGGLDDPATTRRFLEIVRRHADRMGALIEDLTDLSLIETGAIVLDVGPIDVAAAVHDVLEQLRPSADARAVRIVVELPGGLRVVADRRRLEQMLTNLVDNAIKFNRPGGSVTIRGERDATGVRLAVEDTGVGIAADALDRVFQRFYQVDRPRSRELGGTGLGLAIVKHLMRLHGGRVRAESELGAGSRFVLEFPAAAA